MSTFTSGDVQLLQSSSCFSPQKDVKPFLQAAGMSSQVSNHKGFLLWVTAGDSSNCASPVPIEKHKNAAAAAWNEATAQQSTTTLGLPGKSKRESFVQHVKC